MSGLNVVALISGGKDSLFSILHCQANDHNVVALANLHPPLCDNNDPTDDIESYMYQTIGHSVIPIYEQALGLPLYRLAIKGTAVDKNKSYSHTTAGTAEDETESLLTLLQEVKRALPAVNAVSTGAILSDYQRTRVESVALRLGLVPLSYLWQWPSLPQHTQHSLLEDMALVEQDARIIKVASGGLDESFLWQNVADRRTIARLLRAAQRFGTEGDGAVLGEGGEYETLAVAGPSPLWKGRIDILSENVRNINGDAGSASVRIAEASFVPMQGAPAAFPRVPPVLDHKFTDLLNKCISPERSDSKDSAEDLDISTPPTLETDQGVLALENIFGEGPTISEQTRAAMESIVSHLESVGHATTNVAYTIIVLRNMSDFAAFNLVYGSFFTTPNPPARLTIACADTLPVDSLLSLSVTSILGPREGLHVQSRSYWAPANIGPYSQAIKIPQTITSPAIQGAVLIAGQIPLVPAKMELPYDAGSDNNDNFASQVCLSLQHLERIGHVMQVREWSFGIVFMTPCQSHDEDIRRVQVVKTAWRGWHSSLLSRESSPEHADDFDVWDSIHGRGSVPWRMRHEEALIEAADSSNERVPPLVVVQVESLPREADVEWVAYGRTCAGSCASLIPFHLHGLLDRFRNRILSSQHEMQRLT